MAIPSYISDLSNELLVEILCRLDSSKQATQCKSICKRWFSLIKSTNSRDSYFLRRWRKIHQEDEAEQPFALLTQYTLFGEELKDYYSNFSASTSEDEDDDCDYGYRHIHRLSLINKDLPTINPLNFLSSSVAVNDRLTPISVLASCKDLVLCYSKENDYNFYYICNPFTRQWIALPPYPLTPSNIFSVRVGLVVSNDEYGNDLKFKVVRVLGGEQFGDNVKRVEIFSSDDDSNTWRVGDISILAYCYYQYRFVFYDGMLGWSMLGRIILFSIDNVCANTDANYTLLPPLEGNKESILSSQIGVCMGCLRIGQFVDPNFYFHNYVPKLIIWELNRHREDWELVLELEFCEVDLSNLLGDEHLEWPFIMAFHPRNRDILYLEFLLKSKKSMACICNVREKTIELIRDIPTTKLFTTKVFPLEMPSWPTTIPLPSLPPELENRH